MRKARSPLFRLEHTSSLRGEPNLDRRTELFWTSEFMARQCRFEAITGNPIFR